MRGITEKNYKTHVSFYNFTHWCELIIDTYYIVCEEKVLVIIYPLLPVYVVEGIIFKQLYHNILMLYPNTNFYIVYFFISPSHKFIICVRIAKKPTNVLTTWRLKTSICVKCWPLCITIAMLFRI